MVSIGSRRLLGLVIGHKAIVIAELSAGKPSRVVRHDRYEWPAELSLDKPQELGKALGEYLRSQRYAVKQVVVGLPGRWTLLKARTLPPAAASAVPAMLRLAVEREYHSSAREWAFDFITQLGQEQGHHVLLGAAPRSRMDQVNQMLQAAGLSPVAIVPTTLTCFSQINESAVLMASEDGLELAVRSGSRVVAVDRLVASLNQPEALGVEIRRVLAMHQVAESTLKVHDGRPAPQTEADWNKQLGMNVTLLPAWAGQGNAAGQIASAWAASKSQVLDFMHSRLVESGKRKFTRVHLLGALAILAILLLTGFSAVDWYTRWSDVKTMRAELASMQSQLTAAKFNVDRLRLARGWYDARPHLLDAMRAITLAFPTNGQVWVTNLAMRDDMTITLTGKAQDERAAIDLMERMRALPAFADVKLQSIRQADRNSRTVTFSITILYTGKD